MSLVGLILILVLIGVGLYLLNYIPMDTAMRTIIRVIVILVVVLWVIQVFGLFNVGPRITPLH